MPQSIRKTLTDPRTNFEGLQVLKVARSLVGEGTLGDNPEYERAIVDMLIYLHGMDPGNGPAVARLLYQGKGDWTYHLNLAVRHPLPAEPEHSVTHIAYEVGPFETPEAALAFAGWALGKDVDVVGEALLHPERGIVGAPDVDGLNLDDGTGIEAVDESNVIEVITVERYDGENTDGSWSIDLNANFGD